MSGRLKRVLLLTRVNTLLVVLGALGAPLHAQENTLPGRVAVLPFWAFDQQGRVVPQASETDLARPASVLPRAIAARLVQAGKFEVLDHPLLESRIGISVGVDLFQ